MKSAVVIYCVRYKEGDWPDSMDITPDEWQYMKEASDVLAGCYLAVQTLQTSNDAWVSSTLLVIDNLLVSLRIPKSGTMAGVAAAQEELWADMHKRWVENLDPVQYRHLSNCRLLDPRLKQMSMTYFADGNEHWDWLLEDYSERWHRRQMPRLESTQARFIGGGFQTSLTLRRLGRQRRPSPSPAFLPWLASCRPA
jgi:hypothetical protein